METREKVWSSSDEGRKNRNRFHFAVANGNMSKPVNQQFVVPWQLIEPLAGKVIERNW